MTPDVKLLALTHVSNVLGTVNPVREICREARKRGIITVVDGAQAIAHLNYLLHRGRVSRTRDADGVDWWTMIKRGEAA